MTPLVAQDLKRRFGPTQALAGLSLQVDPGEIYGLVGPDGAGKTTALRIMAGMIGPDEGEIRIVGLNPLSADPAVRNALGYMPQQYSLYGDLSVEENLSFFASMFCLKKPEYEERRARLLEITRLAAFTSRRADALSGGMYKKLALACALLPRPKVLLLDEPTNGVDPVSRRELWTLLFELAAQGMAIVVSTSYMDEATRCHRVGLLDRGRLVHGGRPLELLDAFEHPVLEIASPERSRVDQVLRSVPGVLARSNSGERVRVVIDRERFEDAQRIIEGSGLESAGSRPDFEDLFLVRTGAAQ